MAEPVSITVNAKPMDSLPPDPSTVPEAVKRRADAVAAAYYNEQGQRPHDVGSDPETGAPSALSPPPLKAVSQEAPSTPQAPAADSSPSASAPADQDDNSETWKSRFMGLQGRYTSAQKEIGALQEQMTQLGNELLQAQPVSPAAMPAPYSPPPLAVTNYLTDTDVQNYGSELIDLAQRAAAQVVAPQLHRVQEENARLQERLAQEARRNLDQRVEIAVPNYREIDKNPRWHRWLLTPDVLSGRVRQQLLNEAIAAADATRVVSFFKGFLQEEVATGQSEFSPSSLRTPHPREPAIDLNSLAAPGRIGSANGGDPQLPPERTIYTRAQVTKFYADERRGAYVGREAEWARREADIIAAGREGRIQG
jgi:hypothetical protein